MTYFAPFETFKIEKTINFLKMDVYGIKDHIKYQLNTSFCFLDIRLKVKKGGCQDN